MNSIWQGITEGLTDLFASDAISQLGVLALVTLVSWSIERFALGNKLPSGRAWEIGRGGIRRVIFPLVSGLMILAVVPALRGAIHVNLLQMAVPLFLSMAGIRMVFYVLRHSFSSAAWLFFKNDSKASIQVLI